MHAEAFLHNDAGTLKHEKLEPQGVFAGKQDLSLKSLGSKCNEWGRGGAGWGGEA